jgi:putative hydrolase of the HAD superfamily
VENIKHIFFDLDHTLWDFDRNSSETLTELYHQLSLSSEITDLAEFIEVYRGINAKYWDLYNHGKVTKQQVRTERFLETLHHFKVSDLENKAKMLGDQYVHLSPQKKHVFPGAHQTLAYLSKKYPLHIITNGFVEVQHSKLKNSQLTDYFSMILCTEELGVNKPNPIVYQTALERTNALPSESLMIGDNLETDILGAQNCGIKTVHFNPSKIVHDIKTTEIQDLTELCLLL